MQLYSYTMQFANKVQFSQHLVLRYSESPAKLKFGGTAKFFFVLPNSAPSFRHCKQRPLTAHVQSRYIYIPGQL